jgi:nucleoside 2-deoxyribosyltransferase
MANKTRVYVAGCYSADNVLDVLRNIGHGQQACALLFSMGFAPFCPWHDHTFITDRPDDEFTVQQFYEYSLAWLEVSDCVLVLPGWEKSDGTLKEIARAEELGIPVFYMKRDLCAWAMVRNVKQGICEKERES